MRGPRRSAIGVAWFLISAPGRRPLAFVFARAALEGHRRFTDEPWNELWDQWPRLRHTWRTLSVVWGLGLLGDAALRVVLALTLPIDVVALIDHVNYLRSGSCDSW